jgi:uncharacterized tellurite resistance protein B-like protein
MFRTLQDLFKEFTAPAAASPADHEHALLMAAAVLLVEAMRADADLGADERAAVTAALQKRFGMEQQELARLIEQAEAQAKRANDYFLFTNKLNDACSQPDKIALVEAMWDVAYANGQLDANEIHVVSKVAGLLHVTHGEYIAAKMRAKAAAGLS